MTPNKAGRNGRDIERVSFFPHISLIPTTTTTTPLLSPSLFVQIRELVRVRFDELQQHHKRTIEQGAGRYATSVGFLSEAVSF
jgi:hypothetical protein